MVFLIGMRINKPWKIHKWLPVAQAMSSMLNELYRNPDLGLLLSNRIFRQRPCIEVKFELATAFACLKMMKLERFGRS